MGKEKKSRKKKEQVVGGKVEVIEVGLHDYRRLLNYVAILEGQVTRLQKSNSEYIDRARAWTVLQNAFTPLCSDGYASVRNVVGRAVHAQHRDGALRLHPESSPPAWAEVDVLAKECYQRQGELVVLHVMQAALDYLKK